MLIPGVVYRVTAYVVGGLLSAEMTIELDGSRRVATFGFVMVLASGMLLSAFTHVALRRWRRRS